MVCKMRILALSRGASGAGFYANLLDATHLQSLVPTETYD